MLPSVNLKSEIRMRPGSHVFISYRRSDLALVEQLVLRLTKDAGLTIWLDRTRLQPGLSWRREIESALNAASAAVIVWGSEALARIQREERDLAYVIRDSNPELRILNVFLPDAPPPTGSWANVDTWIRFDHGLEDPDAFARLVAALRGEAPPGAIIEHLPDTPAPYRGLSAFSSGDAPFFFGRNAETQEIVARLARYPFIALLGASGSGKTSLLQAGVLPQLQRDGIAGSGSWTVLFLRPGPQPLQAIAIALARLHKSDDVLITADQFLQRLRSDPTEICTIVQSLRSMQGRLLLLVDRLEELFTLCETEAERGAFLQALLSLVRHPHGLACVIVTMRADFYGHLGSYPEAANEIANHQMYVRLLDRADVAEVIEQPAVRVGAIFEKGLAMQVRADATAGTDIILPLLEHTLDLLWRKRRGRWLTWDAYREIGGVSGALRYHAGTVVAALTPHEQDVARRIFMRLIWIPDAGGVIVGRRVERGALVSGGGDAVDERVLQRLADERLLVLREENGQATGELIHDTLPVHWERLRQWVQQDQEFLLWRQRLRTAFEEWQRTSREEAAVLRGSALTEADKWLNERSADLTADEVTFIQAGLTARNRERAARDRNRRRVMASLAAGVVIATGLAGWALTQRYRAERNQQVALARQLVAQAEVTYGQAATLVSRAVLLSVEGQRRVASLEADTTLRRGLKLLPLPLARLAHDIPVTEIAFSPNGRYLAAAAWNHPARVWDVEKRESITLSTHGLVHAIDFSPNSAYVATGSGDGVTAVWEASGGGLVAEFQQDPISRGQIVVRADGSTRPDDPRTVQQPGGVNHLAFSADGRYLASASDDKTARIWDLEARQEVGRFTHDSSVHAVAFSDDGARLASASHDNTARLWDIVTGREIARITHNAGVDKVALSSDGRFMASASGDHSVRLLQIGSEQLPKVFVHNGPALAVQFSPDGRFLATGSSDRTARLWEISNGREIHRLTHQGTVNAVTFSADGRYLASASQDWTARLWSVATGEEVARFVHDERVTDVAFRPGAKVVATSSYDWSVRLWGVSRGDEVFRTGEEDLSGRTVISSVALSADGGLLATSGGGLRVWQWSTGTQIQARTRKESMQWGSPSAFAADAKHLVSINGDKFYLLNLADGKVDSLQLEDSNYEALFKARGNVRIGAIAFSPDGRYATSTISGTTRLWDISDLHPRLRMKYEGAVGSVAFSSDGTRIATASIDPESPTDSVVRIWDTSTGKEIRRMNARDSTLEVVALSRSGRLIASAGNVTMQSIFGDKMPAPGSNLRVWAIETGHEIATLAHEASLTSVAFSPDGQYVAAGCEDGIVDIWDLADNREVVSVKHPGVTRVLFSADGEQLVTAGNDGTARITLWRPERLRSEACRRLTRNLTWDEWQKFFGGELYEKTCPTLPIEPSVVEMGRKRAMSGDSSGAQAIFERAVEVQPTLKLKPRLEANRLAAVGAGDNLVDKANRLTKQNRANDAVGALREALASYVKAKSMGPVPEVTVESWNTICWAGSLWGNATDFLPACDEAIALDPKNGAVSDSRGVARARTGDVAGAITDFQAFVAWTDDAQKKAQRRAWIESLLKHENPFTSDEIAKLRARELAMQRQD